jgi:hypothetical protein
MLPEDVPTRQTNEPKAREFWLGGRDSNPDTVVQRAVLAFP